MRVQEALAARLVRAVTAAEPGHCIRIDDVAEGDAVELAGLMSEKVDPDRVIVAVLDSKTEGIRVDVETAVGIRNDKSHVFALLVPPGQAHAASSLDNSFERSPLVVELDAVVTQLRLEVAERWPALPVQVLLRATRVPLEARLDFLSAVLDGDEEAVFGRELWRVGMLVDDARGPSLRSNIDWNARLVGAVVVPSTITTTLRERLRRAGVAPGAVFEKLVTVLSSAPDLRDSIAWSRTLYFDHGIALPDIPRVHEVESALETLEMQSFRKRDGSAEAFSRLKATDDGALYAETSLDNPGVIGLRWKTKPAKPADVATWLLELVPPADLRTDDSPSALDMKVKGARGSAQLKLELGADDLTGGSLFVVRITALNADATPVLLSDGTLAMSESDPFEVVIQEVLTERSTRKTSAGSLAEAQLRAVLAGAPNTELDMQAWDLGGSVFGVRVGKHLASQIRVAPILVALQRRIIGEPTITAFRLESVYGEPVDPAFASGESFDLPVSLARRRKELLDLLKRSAPHDVPEVFAWDDEARRLASDYALTYKRALDAADSEVRAALLRLDTVSVEVGTAIGAESAVVILPLHPIRVGWIAAHYGVIEGWCEDLLQLGSSKARRLVCDDTLLARVQPTNLPFSCLGPDNTAFIYFDELAFGSALLLGARAANPEAVASKVYGALGLHRESTAILSASAMVSSRLDDFRITHPEANALRIAALNPGDGEILGRAVEHLVSTNATDDAIASVSPPRVEVVAYGRDSGFASPLQRLAALQRELQQAQVPGRQSHLAPPLGLAMRPPASLVNDARSHHVALIQDVAVETIDRARDEGTSRQTTFHDLLTPAITTRITVLGKPSWVTSPALASTADAAARAVVDAHRSHQIAVGTTLGLDGPPALAIDVEPDGLEAIRVLHELSDWVLTLDRYVGLDLYEDPLAIGLGDSSFILDYAPDFIEGLSHRLTVTTKHRGEVVRILERAMDELGLDAVNQSVTPVIENLLAISGRLVLRLQGSENFAREAVSLAALMAHLRKKGSLAGTIIVPVDTHDEIFGRAAREPDHAARRCDLLLVQVQRTGLRIDCVEVKSRKAAALPLQLADDIVDQLEETRRLLTSRFFANDPARVDAQLQRARLAGILHYYADRAMMSGTVDVDRIAEFHKLIDRHLETNAPVEITMHGYVISLQGAAGFPAKHRQVPITVLTAADLGHAGFTTKFDEPREPSEEAAAPRQATPHVRVEPETPVSGGPEHRSNELASGSANDLVTKGAASRATPPSESQTGPRSTHDEGGDAAQRPLRVDVLLGQDSHGSEVVWSVSTQGSPHAFVLGIPGQGKSVTTRRIVREFAAAGLPSLLFDFHGDMAAASLAGASVIDARKGLPFGPFETVNEEGSALNMVAFETAEVVAYVAGLGEIQRSHVYLALQRAYVDVIRSTGPGAPTIEAFATALEDVEASAKGKYARERVRPLTDFGLFAEDPQTVFDPRATSVVIDVSQIPSEQVQLAAGAFLLRKIYRDMFSWPQDGVLKLAIVLDEAHRMAKDVTLPKLMKEGRKYGVCVVVASQGTADFHKDVLGNAGTKIVFRTNFPASKQVAGYLRGRSGQDLSQEIEKLGVGQAYVSTPDAPQSRKVFMAE